MAVVTACRRFAVDPAEVFTDGWGNGKARVLAAAGAAQALGLTSVQSARVFHVHPSKLAPSSLKTAKITALMVEEVARAVRPDFKPGAMRPREAAAPKPARKPAIQSEPRPPARPRAIAAPVAANPVRERSRPFKPVTAKNLRFARWFVAADWPVDEVAQLFHVHPDALVDALAGRLAA